MKKFLGVFIIFALFSTTNLKASDSKCSEIYSSDMKGYSNSSSGAAAFTVFGEFVMVGTIVLTSIAVPPAAFVVWGVGGTAIASLHNIPKNRFEMIAGALKYVAGQSDESEHFIDFKNKVAKKISDCDAAKAFTDAKSLKESAMFEQEVKEVISSLNAGNSFCFSDANGKAHIVLPKDVIKMVAAKVASNHNDASCISDL